MTGTEVVAHGVLSPRKPAAGRPYWTARCLCGWEWPWACGEDEALRTAWAHLDTVAREALR